MAWKDLDDRKARIIITTCGIIFIFIKLFTQ